jgi:formate/nitrite transporter FocA (FNT family)
MLSRTAKTTVRYPMLLAGVLAGVLVAVGLGVFARVHSPTSGGITLGFPAVDNMKVWFATFAIALGVSQLVTASWMYGRLPVIGRAPTWVGPLHRTTGALAIALSLPVAYDCLFLLGLQTDPLRVFAHSIVGCVFYGAVVTKIMFVETKKLPSWVLPVAGGVVFTALLAVWLTSSLWFFKTYGAPSF